MAADEFQGRRARVSAEFKERKVDALAVSFGANLRYLTGFTGSNGLLLMLPQGDAVFFTDPRYTHPGETGSELPGADLQRRPAAAIDRRRVARAVSASWGSRRRT